MSLISIDSDPLLRRQLHSPLSRALTLESNQLVPGSPLSPHLARLAPCRHCSPSSGSPLAQVPNCTSGRGSPLLQQLLTSTIIFKLFAVASIKFMWHLLFVGRKRKSDDELSPSPIPKRGRDSPRVPNSIIVVRRAPQLKSNNGKKGS